MSVTAVSSRFSRVLTRFSLTYVLGIPALEDKEQFFKRMLLLIKSPEALSISFYTDEENWELGVRCLVEEDLENVLNAAPDPIALRRVLFEVIYSCPEDKN